MSVNYHNAGLNSTSVSHYLPNLTISDTQGSERTLGNSSKFHLIHRVKVSVSHCLQISWVLKIQCEGLFSRKQNDLVLQKARISLQIICSHLSLPPSFYVTIWSSLICLLGQSSTCSMDNHKHFKILKTISEYCTFRNISTEITCKIRSKSPLPSNSLHLPRWTRCNHITAFWSLKCLNFNHINTEVYPPV